MVKLKSKQIKGFMNLTYSQDQIETVKGFFTEDEWDAIDSALCDYQDYGDKETRLADSVGNKIYYLFNAFHYSRGM